VGHRALVAYERPTGGYTIRRSQWGAFGYRLLDSITATSPLGARPRDDEHPLVQPGPIGVARDLADVAARFVDPVVHEAAFAVTTTFDVTAFEPLAFPRDRTRGATNTDDDGADGADTESATGPESTTGRRSTTETEVVAPGGALVSLRRDRDPAQDARELRAWVRGATATTDRSPEETAVAVDERHSKRAGLYDALEREVEGRTVERIPRGTRDP
jgi:hypothetical protein